MVERLSDRAKRVLELAGVEARGFGHAYLGPEHLLLGLLDGPGETAAGLRSAGLGLSDARTLVDWIAGIGAPVPADHPISLSDRSQRVVVRALAFARDGGCEEADTDHLVLVLALLVEDQSIAARVIENLGVDRAGMRDRLIVGLAGNRPGLAVRYRESIESMFHAQATASGELVDPFAGELPDLVDGLLESDRQVRRR